MNALSETRKADRTKMAAALVEMAQKYGAETKLENPDSRTVTVLLSLNDARILVDFDGGSMQPNVFVQTWNMLWNSDKRFCPNNFGEVNPFHGKKVNRVAYGFEELLSETEIDLRLIQSGEAFVI